MIILLGDYLIPLFAINSRCESFLQSKRKFLNQNSKKLLDIHYIYTIKFYDIFFLMSLIVICKY